MRLACYIKEGQEQLAILSGNTLYDMDGLHPELPSTMSMFLNYWDDYLPLAKNINESIQEGKISLNLGLPLQSVNLISPVPLPASCRKVVGPGVNGSETIAHNTGSRVIPSFHFTNHHSVQGPGEVSCMTDHMEQLQFELSIAAVVSAQGRNFTADEAGRHTGGYMILIEISVPGQPVNKVIATVLGPWLVTGDELEPYKTAAGEGHTGYTFNLPVKCSLNGQPLLTSNVSCMEFTFAEILESCAYGADLLPGDIIFTRLPLQQANSTDTAPVNTLRVGDIVTIETEGLGISAITITADSSDFSLYNPE